MSKNFFLPMSMMSACMALSVCHLAVAQTRPVLQAESSEQSESVKSVPSGQPALDNGIAPEASSTSYIIGSGDTLKVTVWKEPDMSNPSVPVRPDGMISLPLLGDVQAATLTPMALSLEVQSRLRKYATNPLVTVTLVSTKPRSIYVMGEVAHTGPIQLSPGMTPLQAIAAAGGVTSYANLKSVYILRKSGGVERKIPFNYKRAFKNGDMQSVTLMPDDTIIIP